VTGGTDVGGGNAVSLYGMGAFCAGRGEVGTVVLPGSLGGVVPAGAFGDGDLAADRRRRARPAKMRNSPGTMLPPRPAANPPLHPSSEKSPIPPSTTKPIQIIPITVRARPRHPAASTVTFLSVMAPHPGVTVW
jgi:hypothetical protein